MLSALALIVGFVGGVLSAWFVLPQPRWTWRKHAHHRGERQWPRWLEVLAAAILVLYAIYALYALWSLSAMTRWH